MEPEGEPQQPGTHPCACALAHLLGEQDCSCPQERFCSSPGQLQDLCAGLMGLTLTPMGRQEAGSHPTTLYISHSVGFVMKLLLQSNPPEQCASTISRRVCSQTLCLSLQNPLTPSSCKLVTQQKRKIKRWLSQLPSFTCLGGRQLGRNLPQPQRPIF